MNWIQTPLPTEIDIDIENDNRIATSQDVINQIQAIYDGEDVWDGMDWPVTGQYYELIGQASEQVTDTLEQLKK